MIEEIVIAYGIGLLFYLLGFVGFYLIFRKIKKTNAILTKVSYFEFYSRIMLTDKEVKNEVQLIIKILPNNLLLFIEFILPIVFAYTLRITDPRAINDWFLFLGSILTASLIISVFTNFIGYVYYGNKND